MTKIRNDQQEFEQRYRNLTQADKEIVRTIINLTVLLLKQKNDKECYPIHEPKHI